jgi:hypothetical protein
MWRTDMLDELINKVTAKLLRKRVSAGFARNLLIFAEKVYLQTNGWEEIGPDTWDSPFDHPKSHIGIRQSHAVNSMKKWDDVWPYAAASLRTKQVREFFGVRLRKEELEQLVQGKEVRKTLPIGDDEESELHLYTIPKSQRNKRT